MLRKIKLLAAGGNETEWAGDLGVVEGLRARLCAVTFYYKYPKIQGVFGHYIAQSGRIVEGNLFGKAEGDEIRMSFKSPEKPQIIQAKFGQEGVLFLKITTNFSGVITVGENGKNTKHTSQFKSVLKDSETLGCLSCVLNAEDQSILGLSFDVI